MQAVPLYLRFDAEIYPAAADRVAAWRDAMSLAVDVVFTPDEADSFDASLDFFPLGPVVLTLSRATPHSVVRSKATIARSGDAHVILDLFLSGGFVGNMAGKPIEVGPGDCFVMDLAQTMQVHLEAASYIGVVMPRRLFEDQVGSQENLHGVRFAAASPEAKLIAAMLPCLVAEAARLSPARAEQLGVGLVSLICSCIAKPRAIVRKTQAQPTVVEILRHIERHASDPDLDAADICATFQISRTALYELLKPHGGVAELVRGRRVALAHRLLVAASHKSESFEHVARASGFANERAMRRALRDFYETTPSQLRQDSADQETIATEHTVKIGAFLDNHG